LAGFTAATWILSWKSGSVINSHVYRPVFLAVLPAVGVVLAILCQKTVLIIGTSITGAICIASAVDTFYPVGFNAAINLYLTNNGFYLLTDSMIVLLSATAGAVIVGILIQYKLHAIDTAASSFRKHPL
jgi:hypothetical protein